MSSSYNRRTQAVRLGSSVNRGRFRDYCLGGLAGGVAGPPLLVGVAGPGIVGAVGLLFAGPGGGTVNTLDLAGYLLYSGFASAIAFCIEASSLECLYSGAG